jgi:tellurite resistance protein TerC
VIVSILGLATAASLLKVRRDPTARAHAGSLREHETGPTDTP